MAPSHTEEPGESGPITERGFWTIYVVAWLAYGGLVVSVEGLGQGLTVSWALLIGVMNVGPPAALGCIVALNRGKLLRPDWGLGRIVAVQVGTGLAYAVSTAAVLTVIATLSGLEAQEWKEIGKGAAFMYRTVQSGFLYVLLAGFLMWAESLRRVHESQRMAAREAILRAQAEAKALRAQFNPHFVFNTLHSLMLLVRADPAAAERAIEDVATLIRYASILQRSEIDAVPLTKELEVARRYLALEQLRLEDRLRVSWDVKVEPAQVSVPSFALQTLVENAIKHGLEPKPEGGTVEIRVTAEEGVLCVTVSDDGAGADPQSVGGAEGHGLDLLKRRLQTLYDEEGSLTWTTAPGEGFKVTVCVPETGSEAVPELGLIQAMDPA